MFFKIGALENFVNFTGKHLYWSFLLIKLQALMPASLLKTDSTQVFFYETCKLFKNNFFYRTPPVAASENNKQQQLSESFANSCYRIISPIFLQELINDFAAYKHCIGTLLLVEDVTSSHVWKLELHISKRNHTF